MSTRQNAEIARRFVTGAWNDGDLDLIDDLIHVDYVVPGVGTGPAAVRKNIITFRVGFPDLQWVIEDVIAQGDKVVLRLTMHGTHLGEFHGIPATGRQVTMQEIVIWEVSSGQIHTGWFGFDALGLRRQLGAIPDASSDCS